MDAHPVPQNVTSFEFHLVGDMTLKQFGYLAVGLIIAYLTFLFFFNSIPYIATPVIIISAGLGAAFAFLPIYNRPLDHWVTVFFRAIFSPTQRTWRTPADKPLANDLRAELIRNRLQLFMQTSTYPQPQSASSSTPLPVVNLRRLPINTQPNSGFVPQPNSSPRVAPQQEKESPKNNTGTFINPKMPTPEELNHLVEMARQTQMLQGKTLELEKEVSQLKALVALQANKATSPAQISQTGSVIKQANSQLEQLQRQATQVIQQPPIPMSKPATKPPKVVIIETPKQTKTVIALTSLPNIINGIITDSTGNYLENVIVIIHNQDNLPVRALKTNKLGQFTGATPLPSGIYTITLEKDGFDFDTLQITLNNQVVPPIKVTAKKGG